MRATILCWKSPATGKHFILRIYLRISDDEEEEEDGEDLVKEEGSI